jgi:hypothetical protein
VEYGLEKVFPKIQKLKLPFARTAIFTESGKITVLTAFLNFQKNKKSRPRFDPIFMGCQEI